MAAPRRGSGGRCNGMKAPLRIGPRVRGDLRGFTLIEIAVVMVIIGILAGGGVSLMRVLTERKARTEALSYLKDTHTSLLAFAERTGRLPYADSDGDGLENSGVVGGSLPYRTLTTAPTDAYKRPLRYALNPNLGTNRASACSALRMGLTGTPQVVDADGTAATFPIAAILASAGPMDADGDGNVFDDLAAGTHQGDNTDGTPNYLRHPPVAGFDDLVVYVGGNELYSCLCEYLSLAVNNHSGSTVYVYDANQGSDLGSQAAGSSSVYSVLSGSRLVLCSGSGGCASPVASNPPTPIALAGRGVTITLP
jgi:prepilin-type N-terminal cleavage/methylation domain-containing protein